jgi:hypothetical protein
MNQYLLLRDNKQSGPYSKEELIAKGLKKYDLVWLEGRSAAWRYPCEFEELKPYAPEVEEQPFDRFYKRPADKAQPSTSSKQTVQEEKASQPVAAKAMESTAARHIYVTMPVGKANTPPKEEVKNEEKPVVQKEQQPQAKKSTPATTYLISEEDDELNSALLKSYHSKKKEEDETNNYFLSDYEARKAAYQSKKSGGAAKTETAPEKREQPALAVTAKKTETDSYSRHNEPKEAFALPRMSGSFFQDNKMLTRGLLAACLILGGVVIGLIINSNKHRPADTQVLESLVKEIRELQNNKSAATTPGPAASNQEAEKLQEDLTDNDHLNNYTDQPSANSALSAEPNARHAVIKKENHTKDTKAVAVPVANTEPERTEPQQPAATDNKEKINQETLEKARKNIYDLVGVEASQYKVGLLGGISDLDITISNNSLYALDQVAVEIKYFGPEKKLVKTRTLMFNHVPPGKQRTLEAPRTNRGITIDYAITGINSKALGLAQASY